MTGEELYQLGKGSPAAQACIPLEMGHTAPRILFCGEWQAQIWYYRTDYMDKSVFAPAFTLVLELPAGNAVRMEKLEGRLRCLGAAPEVVDPEYYQRLHSYLDQCAALMDQPIPEEGQLTKLEAEWYGLLPEVMKGWFAGRLPETGEVSEIVQTEPEPASENLAQYWKNQMEKAVKLGDEKMFREAQQSYLKAMKKK